MILAAMVTFFGFWLLSKHLTPQTMRRIVGYIGLVDLCLHLTILIVFHNTFIGLMQAEASGIMFSLYLRRYRHKWGFERYGRWTPPKGPSYLCWVRTVGHSTRIERAKAS